MLHIPDLLLTPSSSFLNPQEKPNHNPFHPFTTPGLPQQQRDEMNSRAFQRFGKLLDSPESFDSLTPDTVFTVTLRYTNGFIPDRPRQYDTAAALEGGYPMQHILVCVAKVTSRIIETDVVVVELEQPAMLTYNGGGPMFEATEYALHRDGRVLYLNVCGKPRNWVHHHRPTWERTVFPVLPVVVRVF